MKLTERYPIRWYDIEVERKFADRGRALEQLPFRSTVYVIGTGTNISDNDPSKNNVKKDFSVKRIIRKLNPITHKRITPKIKKEFGMK